MSRQLVLETRACSIHLARGLDGLKAWIRSLPDADRVLLDGWLVEAEPPAVEEVEPVEEAEAEPEPAASAVEMEAGYYQVCPHCDAEQVTVNERCWDCKRDLRIKEAA